MINFSLICKSKHWPARLKKVDAIIKKVLKFRQDLNFDKNIDYCCNIILSNDELLKKMNFKFRKKNISTDILTFISEINFKKNKKQKICNIFLSAEMILKDAKDNDISFYNHLTHLCIHSFLHINGFVHNKISDFNKMKKVEIKVLNKIGISNPYIQN
jgi:probable rRNA maturation factor